MPGSTNARRFVELLDRAETELRAGNVAKVGVLIPQLQVLSDWIASEQISEHDADRFDLVVQAWRELRP